MRPRFSAAIASLAARSAAALSRWTHRVGVSSQRRLLWQADPRLATLRHTHHNTQGSRRLARTIFKDEHELFRKTVSAFIDREIAPHYERWEKEGQVSREVWRKAGEAGLLLSDIPPSTAAPAPTSSTAP
jgi:acyl-CoA dehydrogenase-like protein